MRSLDPGHRNADFDIEAMRVPFAGDGAARGPQKTIDYLETRPDIDHQRIGYLGLSLGSFSAPILLAMENRIRAATLTYGGLTSKVRRPIEKDAINYALKFKSDDQELRNLRGKCIERPNISQK